MVRKLCKTADIIVEPFRKGVMESLNLGPNILLKDNPRLIYARLSGFGQNGPFSSMAGHDINYVAMSGLLSLFGRSNENPLFPVNLAADFGGGGLMCALGILLALFEREKSNLGQIVDCDMVSGTAYLGSWLYRSQTLPIWGNERGKNILDSGAHFYETYKTKDGKYMSVGAVEPKFYAQLLKGLDLNNISQFDSFEENKKLFAEKFAQKTQKEWCDIFEHLDACVAPVLTLTEAPKHPHNVERKAFVNGEKIPAPAPKLNRTPAKSSAIFKSPNIGEHTENILKELNYDNEEIITLEREGVIGIHRKGKF